MIESPPNRDLTDAERSLVRWMLEHGGSHARSFLAQFDHAQVTPWRCPCGCASLQFSVVGQPEPDSTSGMRPLADGIFGAEGDQSGIFVYERRGVLAGVEVYGRLATLPISYRLQTAYAWSHLEPQSPNNALQRTAHGGYVFSAFHVLRRHGPSLSLVALVLLR